MTGFPINPSDHTDSILDKRIVVHQTQGRYAGLWYIVGVESQLGQDVTLPSFIEDVQFRDGHSNGVSLVASRRRYHFYRELIVPQGLGTFHQEQQ